MTGLVLTEVGLEFLLDWYRNPGEQCTVPLQLGEPLLHHLPKGHDVTSACLDIDLLEKNGEYPIIVRTFITCFKYSQYIYTVKPAYKDILQVPRGILPMLLNLMQRPPGLTWV